MNLIIVSQIAQLRVCSEVSKLDMSVVTKALKFDLVGLSNSKSNWDMVYILSVNRGPQVININRGWMHSLKDSKTHWCFVLKVAPRPWWA